MARLVAMERMGNSARDATLSQAHRFLRACRGRPWPTTFAGRPVSEELLMRLILSLAALLLFTATLPGVVVADARPDSYILPGDAVFPEGVAFEQDTGFFYVSSTTDGTIFRGTLDSPEAEVFLAAGTDGRTTATGLE